MTDKIISVYWFAVLFIVVAAVVYMVVLFYGEPYDVREVEANIMINQIADCLSKGGELEEGIVDAEGVILLTDNNLLSKCHLNFNVEDTKGWNNDQYFVNISFYDFVTGDFFGDSVISGNVNLEDWCDKKGKSFPKCVERSFYTLDNSGNNQYTIKILSVVGKVDKNVR